MGNVLITLNINVPKCIDPANQAYPEDSDDQSRQSANKSKLVKGKVSYSCLSLTTTHPKVANL